MTGEDREGKAGEGGLGREELRAYKDVPAVVEWGVVGSGGETKEDEWGVRFI